MINRKKSIDITGMVFGKLTAINIDSKPKEHPEKWLCQCSCGNTKIANKASLINGSTKSCGCYRKELLAKRNTKSSLNIISERIFRTWTSMKSRCYLKTNVSYSVWGGRGIKICDDWLSFENFQEWALSNGYADNLTIDRIDNDKNYQPNNCQWISREENARKKRNTIYLTVLGITKTRRQWRAFSQENHLRGYAICMERSNESFVDFLTTKIEQGEITL
jgi:hypothetical protein